MKIEENKIKDYLEIQKKYAEKNENDFRQKKYALENSIRIFSKCSNYINEKIKIEFTDGSITGKLKGMYIDENTTKLMIEIEVKENYSLTINAEEILTIFLTL